MIALACDRVREPLYAIVPVFNPWRSKARTKHAHRALKHFHDSGAVIILVEIGFNRRELVFADSGLDGTLADCGILGDHNLRHKYVSLHTKDELWLKECAINIGVQNIPDYHWQNVCWLDADVYFVRPNWVGECIQKLQHHKFLHMFSQARDVGPNYELLPENYPHASGASFVQAWRDGCIRLPPAIEEDLKSIGADLAALVRDFAQLEKDLAPSYPPNVWPGLAWACTREAWDAVGGLFDVAIWGGGDYDMAHALIEQAAARVHPGAHPNYRRLLCEWERRCRKHIRRNVGVMEGALLHHWHGRKRERKYIEKRALMHEVSFDPLLYLKRDYQGLYQMHDDDSHEFVHFRDMMRRIAKERNEDSIDL